MLKPEQAKARLDEWRLPETENRLAAGIQKLPPRVREVAKNAAQRLAFVVA